jgi:tRNA(fMet)-specific endonuclease VapC
MVILDTDHMSLLEWGQSSESMRLRERLADLAPEEVATTIINYEEQVRGWMAYVSKARSARQRLVAYERLLRHLDNYRQIRVLPFDEGADREFERLRRSRLRIGTMDLKIAAVALALDATLLSRNLADFTKVPALNVEDWTA